MGLIWGLPQVGHAQEAETDVQVQQHVQRVCVYLQYGHLIPQLALLLGGKAKLVYDFDCYVPSRLPVLSC